MAEIENRTWSKVAIVAVVTGAAALAGYFALKKLVGESKSSLSALVNEIKTSLATPTSLLKEIAASMATEMSLGLQPGRGSRLKMLPSFVDRLPTGSERGTYYALDLGGTNFRVLRVVLGGTDVGIVRQEYEEVTIPTSLKKATTEELFNFIAEKLADFVSREGLDYAPAPGQQRELGFTFSFPVEQTAINRGLFIEWTKGFEITGTEGRDIVEILEEAISRQNISMNVSALVNDTVGTLAGARYWDNDSMVAVILGTGTNACYVEDMNEIVKWDGPRTPSETMVINTEWGNFSSLDLPLTFADVDLDNSSNNKGLQIFEKLISGMYLGEIARRILLYLSIEGKLFGPTVPHKLTIENSLPTPKLSEIDGDSSENLVVVGEVLETKLDIADSTLEQRRVVHSVCEAIAERGARLSAAGIVGVLKKIGRDASNTQYSDPSTHLRHHKTRVAVDGGLYEHYPKFRKQIHSAVEEMLGAEAVGLITIELSKDGSGIGAALLAASNSSYNEA